ncbi:MAG: hypothetical protein JOZ81_03410 [Chloroflexi bacterium]|nr:hypothetical protein [Chloroflexota bacterium]MBV9546873.1 hypothetical protein [Chloroflexota bacterium]
MTEPLTEKQISMNGTLATATEPAHAVDLLNDADVEMESADESPPGTPRWLKVLGILLVMLLLAFAGLHLTGNSPMHMAGASGAPHGLQLP